MGHGVKVEMVVERQGYPKIGTTKVVSPDRADRWVGMGIARRVRPAAEKAAAEKAAEEKAAEEKAAAEKAAEEKAAEEKAAEETKGEKKGAKATK